MVGRRGQAAVAVVDDVVVEHLTIFLPSYHIDHNFVDLQRRDIRCLNRGFVSRRGASLDPGTDVMRYEVDFEFYCTQHSRSITRYYLHTLHNDRVGDWNWVAD